jgi:long-chain acyl-CoA synthetase
MELLMAIEEAAGARVADEEGVALNTVEDLVRVVERGLEAAAGQTEAAPDAWPELVLSAGPDDLPDGLRRERGAAAAALVQAGVASGRWLARLLLQLEVRGAEQLPERGPYLLCPNHVSYLDGFVLAASLPRHVVRQAFALGESMYVEHGWLRAGASFLGVVATDANRNLRRAMRVAAAGLKQGRVLVVFPEGTRSVDGKLQELKLGAAILASELDAPIVPALIEGTFEAWPRGRRWPRLAPVRVTFGRPFRPSQLPDAAPRRSGGVAGVRDVAADRPGAPGSSAQAYAKVNAALERALVELGAPPRDRPVLSAARPETWRP